MGVQKLLEPVDTTDIISEEQLCECSDITSSLSNSTSMMTLPSEHLLLIIFFS